MKLITILYNRHRARLILSAIVLGGLLLRVYLLITRLNGVDSDEAITGLMAVHILGGERPLLYYGLNYYGPLDSYLTAPIFAVFSSQAILLKIVPLISSLIFVVSIYLLGKSLYSETIGLYSALFAAFPPLMLQTLGLYANADYILPLVFGTFSLYLFDRFRKKPGWVVGMAIGALLVVGFWIHPIMAYYLATIALVWILDRITRLRVRSFYSRNRTPLVATIFAILLLELLVWFGKLDSSTSLAFFRSLVQILTVSFPVIFGFYRDGSQMVAPFDELVQAGPQAATMVLLLTFIILACILWTGIRQVRQGNFLLFGFASFSLSIFVLFVGLLHVKSELIDFPRHAIAFYSAIPLGMAALFYFTQKAPWLRPVLMALILVVFLASAVAMPVSYQSQQALIDWVDQADGPQYVYTDYWIGYWLAFATHEKAIPYIIDTYLPGVDRYAPYTLQVEQARSPIYIYSAGSAGEKVFVENLTGNEIGYQLTRVGEYDIYSNLSTQVTFPLGKTGDP
jgi:hypothetical protein